jgi:arginine deiminase-like protein
VAGNGAGSAFGGWQAAAGDGAPAGHGAHPPDPSNAEELLFDDVLWVSRAKQEHDAFCEVMRDRGVQVFEVERLLAEALAEPGVRTGSATTS